MEFGPLKAVMLWVVGFKCSGWWTVVIVFVCIPKLGMNSQKGNVLTVCTL